MRAFLDQLQVVSGLVQAFTLDTLAADDLPRPSPNPAGSYTLVTVDQWGRVVGGVVGSVNDLAHGGTGSDLSAAGPGLVFQASTGAVLAPTDTIALNIFFTSQVTVVGGLFCSTLYDQTGSIALVLDPGVPSVAVSGGSFAGDGSLLTGLALFGGGTGNDLSGSGPGLVTQAAVGAALTVGMTLAGLGALTADAFVGDGTGLTGLPQVRASADLTGRTAAVASVATYTPGADGTYRVGVYLTITAVLVDVIQAQVTYTDETGTARTLTFFPQGLTNANLSTTGAFGFPTMDLRCQAGGAVTVKTVLTTGTGSITYDVGATIEQLR